MITVPVHGNVWEGCFWMSVIKIEQMDKSTNMSLGKECISNPFLRELMLWQFLMVVGREF